MEQKSDHLTRFDIYCKSEDQLELLGRLKIHQHKWGWYLRRHIAEKVLDPRFRQDSRRRVRVEEPPKPQKEANLGLRVGTLNVNGVRGKQVDLRYLLENRRIGCLALQETLLRATDWNLNIPGYHCYARCGERTASTRGVALLLSKSESGYPVGRSSPWSIFVRCTGTQLAQPWIVASVYVPSGKSEGATPMKKIQEQVKALREEFPDDAMAIMGDWNRTRCQVARFVRAVDPEFEVLEPVAGRRVDTRGTRRRSDRTIDHIAVRMVGRATKTAPKVLRDVDISDHYPVVGTIACPKGDGEGGTQKSVRTKTTTPRRKIDSDKIPVPGSHTYMRDGPRGAINHQKVVTSNYWAPLLQLAETDTGEFDKEERQVVADAMAERFVETCHRVAEESGLTAAPRTPGPEPLKERIVQRIKARTKAYIQAMKTTPGTDTSNGAWAAYEARKKEATAEVEKDNRAKWKRRIQKASEHLQTEPRNFWKWASNIAGWSPRCKVSGVQPVKHAGSGSLLTEVTAISAAWRDHYGRLAADPTGNSQSPDRWTRWGQCPQRKHLEYLDEDIPYTEMLEALNRIRRNKAPGQDGIPADLLKLAVAEEPTPMGNAFLAVLNHMWKSSTIPSAWRNSTVVSIPKKGDLTDMGNYRGISLMAAALKVLMVVLSTRLNGAFEKEGIFSKAQAGFRRKEECVTQSACLLEITKRRKLMGLPTYMLFVDLKKAYDTVPQEALMAKLDFYGVRGRALGFIRALYSQSRIQVRVGGTVSEPADLLRGVRQGCPLSPVLFNIFINDVMDGAERSGVPVRMQGGVKTRIPGLLFADDLVALSRSRKGIERMTRQVTEWTAENEMSVGIQKCGIMVVNKPLSMLHQTPARWQIAGQLVPIVSEYTYWLENGSDPASRTGGSHPGECVTPGWT